MPPAAPWSASLTGHRGGVWGCAWSSDGRWVLSASGDKTLRIWDAASGAMVRELTGHTDVVRGCAAWSSDGRWVLSAASDGTLRTWDAATGACTAIAHQFPDGGGAWLDPASHRFRWHSPNAWRYCGYRATIRPSNKDDTDELARVRVLPPERYKIEAAK